MHQSELSKSKSTLPGKVRAALRSLTSRRVLIPLMALAAAALVFNWNALAAAGLLPLLAFLPCVAMCAFGICKKEGADGSVCSKSGSAAGQS